MEVRLASANWNITRTSDNADNAFNCQMARALIMGTNKALLLRRGVSLLDDETTPTYNANLCRRAIRTVVM